MSNKNLLKNENHQIEISIPLLSLFFSGPFDNYINVKC